MLSSIVLGGGCFWCLEAVYSSVHGVVRATSGYANGRAKNPTYKDVCTGDTGYAEVVLVEYDNENISFEKILEIFWDIHDPTTLNKQGNDVGTQYRSGIYYSDDAQKNIILKSIISAQQHFSSEIITEVKPLQMFYPAEDYHQNYFVKNPTQGYCIAVVAPKVNKFYDKFKELAK